MIGFNNGRFETVSNITIPITSLSINRGFGAFDFFEVINNKPFYGDRHINRFKQSLKILRLKTDFEDDLPAILDKMIALNELTDFYVKIFALPHDADTPTCYNSSLYLFPTLMPQYNNQMYLQGAKLLLKKYERFLPEAKSTNYIFGQYLQNEIDEAGALDVLYTNGKTIQETSRGNIFIVKNGCVYTPATNVLKGVTRSIAIDILKQQSINFIEKEITTNELFEADEVFVSSTTKLVVPIIWIDGKTIGSGHTGEVTLKLMREFKLIKQKFGGLIQTP